MNNTFLTSSLSSLLAMVLLLISCSKEDSADVNQDRIYTEYVLHYNQNDDKTHAVARFRFGNSTGTLLELTDASGAMVKFNGAVMPYSLIWSGHHIEFAGNLTSGTFEYTNTEGTVYTNNIPTGADTVAFPTEFDTIIKSQAQTFAWVGSALSPNQSVGMYIGTWAWNKDALFFTNANGASSMVLGVQAKSNLNLGQGNAYLLRKVETTNINGTSRGGVIRYSYRPFDKTITVVP